jgi:hypothetical protein
MRTHVFHLVGTNTRLKCVRLEGVKSSFIQISSFINPTSIPLGVKRDLDMVADKEHASYTHTHVRVSLSLQFKSVLELLEYFIT